VPVCFAELHMSDSFSLPAIDKAPHMCHVLRLQQALRLRAAHAYFAGAPESVDVYAQE
jgi:hypothetical protein